MNKAKTKKTITSKATRDVLLDAAFEEIYHKGFQAACIDDIIANVGLTKGALYYYFPSKVDLGLAVIDEKVKPTIDEFWLPVVKVNEKTGVPHSHLDTLVNHIRENFASLSSDICEFGCPLNNLAQEMAPLDEQFKTKLNDIFEYWRVNLAAFIRAGQSKGEFMSSSDPADISGFIVAAIEGIVGAYKTSNKAENYAKASNQLIYYIESLRPSENSANSQLNQ